MQDFLTSRGTLYVMGRDVRYGSVAPLFSALVGEIYDAAYVRADNTPAGAWTRTCGWSWTRLP